ncbi:hypothetical protein Scep_012092 [Stephania cephalantha]|uniref:Uncharacterized protein n=1 Tax=Stephania cephalantha TaxID=152367 RepID=A0AAP0P754_9MAGN
MEWESLSIDLLPYPDMFLDASLTCSDNGAVGDVGIITIQRTELNTTLGLEVQLDVLEAVCPALSEPGLRALLRLMTGFYVFLNRGDVDPRASQQASVSDGENTKNLSRITLKRTFSESQGTRPLLEPRKLDSSVVGNNHDVQNSFVGARLHVENLIFSESPAIKLPLLNLEKDPASFLLSLEGQPIDATRRKYTIQSSHLSLSLETYHS